ncbi:MAG: hypothetical protein V4709_12720 [Pseudomonadota bacterium]
MSPHPIATHFPGSHWLSFRMAIALLACLFGTAAEAQLEPIDAPVSFSAAPAIAVPGTPVLLKGRTPFVTDPPGEVSLQISPPASDGGDADGTPVTVTAPLDKDGNYSLSYTDTEVMGEYRIVVTAPDGKGSSTGKFAVLLMSGEKMAEQVTGTVYQGYKETFVAAELALDGAAEILRSLPPSPEKDEALGKLEPLKGELENIRKDAAAGALALGEFAKAVADPGTTGAPKKPVEDGFKEVLAPVLEAAVEMKTQSRAQQVQINQRLADSRAASDQCAKLDTAVELLTLASNAINFTEIPKAVISKLLGYTPPVKPGGAGSEIAGGALYYAKKASTGLGIEAAKEVVGMQAGSVIKSPATIMAGIVVDTTKFVAKHLYQKSCTRFEGPFSGKLTTALKHEGQQYWKYSLKVKGKLILSAPKGATVTLMKGRFEGLVTEYAVDQDVVNVFAPKLRTQLVYERLIVPPLLGNLASAESLGSFYNQLIPNSFYLPVVAQRESDKITLNITEGGMVGLPASYNRAQIFLVFMSMMIPELVHQTVPMQSPEFLMTRAMKKNAVFEIKTVGDQQTFSRTFDREVEPDGEVKVTFHADVKACAPKCTK